MTFGLVVLSLSAESRTQDLGDNHSINKSFLVRTDSLDSDGKEATDLKAGKSYGLRGQAATLKDSVRIKPLAISPDRIDGQRIPSMAADEEDEPNRDGSANPGQIKEQFHWKPALIQSGTFLGVQHGFRLFQSKTTSELGGPFFRDWGKSIRNLRGWSDGDNGFTNNFAHPLQGGVTGRLFVNNSDRAKKLEFGHSKIYWESRFKAFVWSAAWSTQFEFGPVSEATIGNVGLHQKNGYSTMAWTDLVMTPVVGTAVLIEEDMVDKYVLKNWLERKNNYRVTTKIKLLRSVLTPTTSFSNLLRGKVPWKRDTR